MKTSRVSLLPLLAVMLAQGSALRSLTAPIIPGVAAEDLSCFELYRSQYGHDEQQGGEEGQACRATLNFQITNLQRFGNFLQQLTNAINVAKHTGSQVTFPAHPLLQHTVLDFRAEDQKGCPTVEVENEFWQWGGANCMPVRTEFLGQRRQLLLQHVLPALQHGPLPQADTTLVVHIRSGDIFFKEWHGVHGYYVQPPLAYYQLILTRHRYSEVVICTEDMSNPVLEALRRWRPELSITLRPLHEDLGLMLGAKNLAIGAGTFGEMAALLSPHIQRLHVPYCELTDREVVVPHGNLRWYVPDISPGFGGFCYEFPGYTRRGEWENSEEQRALMLSYDLSRIREHRIAVPHEEVAGTWW